MSILQKGRAALTNSTGRFEPETKEAFDDGWGTLETLSGVVPTTVAVDNARSIISYNKSPDVPFDRSINPYRGCEHGCVYCFARPTHAYWGLSPGLDFESKLFYKPDAVSLLRAELAASRYTCAPVALGINTDAYQPIERRLRVTRGLLELLWECRHPVTIVTKSALIERDLDVLEAMARENLIEVAVSITTLDRDLARRMEPRAAAPQRRLTVIESLAKRGVPVSVLVAPLIPVLTDSELETIMAQARTAGAVSAGYVVLRLPHEVNDLFQQWLQAHEPHKAAHVMARVRDMRGGKDYQAEFGARMVGTGMFAELLRKRFSIAYKRLGFVEHARLNTALFRRPAADSRQLSLF